MLTRFVTAVLSGLALAVAAAPPLGATTCDVDPNSTLLPATWQCGTGSVSRWQCWQASLTAQSTYANAYHDIQVNVTFTLPGYPGLTHSTHAFWDGQDAQGKDVYRFRTAFPRQGTWTWQSGCNTRGCASDSGLVSSGTVTVTNNYTANPLYKNGFLQQTTSTARGVTTVGHPSHAENGRPFFWHGDTAWAATLRASCGAWQTYVADRKAKGFTVVHLALAPDWAGPADSAGGGTLNVRGHAAFSQVCSSSATVPNTCSRMNPTFWRQVEGMVKHANDQGLVVFFTGLMEPVGRWPALAEAKIFTRHLAARMAGSFVVFSPGFDNCFGSNPSCVPDGYNRIAEVAGVLRETVSRHLITNHFGTVSESEHRPVQDDLWLGFQMVQSGHNNSDVQAVTERAYSMPRTVSGFAGTVTEFNNPRKPVINGEAAYDYGYLPSHGTFGVYSAYRARQTAWTSWLSGATGITYGAAGLWDWGICSGTQTSWNAWCFGTSEPQPQSGFQSPATAVNAGSAQQMKALADFMKLQAWNQLTPEQGRILFSNSDPLTRKVAVRSIRGLLAYLPHNDRIKLNLAGFVPALYPPAASFVDPVTGIDLGASGIRIQDHGTGEWSFWNTAFDNGATPTVGTADRVLLVRGRLPWDEMWVGTSANRLEVWASDDGSGLEVRGQVLDATDQPVGAAFAVTSASALVRAPAVARDGAGNFVVVWEQRADPDAPGEIFARRLDASGTALGAPFLVAATAGKDLALPTVAADDHGRFVVAWQEWGEDGNPPRILAKAYNASGWSAAEAGFEIGAPLPLSGMPGAHRAPQITCDAGGTCLAAWESVHPTTQEVSIEAQELTSQGVLNGNPFPVSATAEVDIWLVQAFTAADGTQTVRYEKRNSGASLGFFERSVDGTARTLDPEASWN